MSLLHKSSFCSVVSNLEKDYYKPDLKSVRKAIKDLQGLGKRKLDSQEIIDICGTVLVPQYSYSQITFVKFTYKSLCDCYIIKSYELTNLPYIPLLQVLQFSQYSTEVLIGILKEIIELSK